MSYTSRIPQIAAKVPVLAEATAREVADLVASRARHHVPVRTGALRRAIHVEEGDLRGEFFVIAGDDVAWYGHIVEHGGARTPPHPFMTPAAEESRAVVASLGAKIFLAL